jgi:hypothetical protein
MHGCAASVAVLPLAEIEAELPLAEIYDGVEFVPEPDDDLNQGA